jgi:hypothetical protein
MTAGCAVPCAAGYSAAVVHTRGVVDENKHHGALFRFKVFHRAGKKCERCGGIIDRITALFETVLLVSTARNKSKTVTGVRF